ncbi:MAG: serine protein kinase PrkA [Deltaproteobacteria bacterium]|nr:serine protein kinase PrkA [Deltaproteobacteria bacterium]
MAEDTSSNPTLDLDSLGEELRTDYGEKRRLLSFAEYFELVQRDPVRHARSAAQYTKDVFDHYGTYEVQGPAGPLRRFTLFDCPFGHGRDRLAGHEEVQNRVYRSLEGFIQQGKVNRLIVLHGPNGSAKSTFVDVLARGLKHYSMLDEGALYRFNWVFPSGTLGKSGIGFAKALAESHGEHESYARLPDTMIEARLPDELRDHPFLLVPASKRRRMLHEMLEQAGATDFVLSDYLKFGDLSHRNRQVFEALLAAYSGDYAKVLRHVQVERFFLSRRYRVGLVTVDAKLAVDAYTRQLTMDQSLAHLPPVLQNLELFRYGGDLVAANRGVIDFSDLLKRPVDAFKYLLSMVETGRVALDSAVLYTDTVLFGSTNELHLAAFREMPDFQSFRGRFELVQVPYLTDYRAEEDIYRARVSAESVGRPAPHVLEMASVWAILTRLYRPEAEAYPESIREAVSRLSALDKALFYSDDVLPDWVEGDVLRTLQASKRQMVEEHQQWPNYEGNSGVSPRTVLAILLAAGRRREHGRLSALDVLAEIEDLIEQKNLYDFLRRPVQEGGYWDSKASVESVRSFFLSRVEQDMWQAVGLLDELKVDEIVADYVDHVSSWVNKERVRNQLTGAMEPPDEKLMNQVEDWFGPPSNREAFRNDVITRVAAWAIEHAEGKPDLKAIFARELRNFRTRAMADRRTILEERLRAVITLVEEHEQEHETRAKARDTLETLHERFGYDEASAMEAIGLLLSRFGRKATK